MAKELLKLTQDNYYSTQANMDYMSVSQLKDFLKCPRYALAKISGEYVEQKTDALLVGGYVDAHFSDRLEQYIENTPELLDKRQKEKVVRKAIVVQAQDCINTAQNDDFFVSELKGEKQKIITGVINNVDFKGALDFVDDDDITDLKCVASIKELSWNDKLHKYTNFIVNNEYDLQGAIYQELERQRVGKKKKFRIAGISKEENPDKAIIELPQSMLDNALASVYDLIPQFDLMKRGLLEPTGCGNCPVCRKYNRLNRVVSYEEMFSKGENENVD